MGANRPQWWRRKSSRKIRDAVLSALRVGVAMTPLELACEIRTARRYVCGALDDLLVRGQVDMHDGRYQRVADSSD